MNFDYSISRFYETKLKIYRWEWMEGRFLDVLHSKWEVVCALTLGEESLSGKDGDFTRADFGFERRGCALGRREAKES